MWRLRAPPRGGGRLQAHLRFQRRALRPANVVEGAAALLVGMCADAEVAPAVIGYPEVELMCAALDFLKVLIN